VSEEDVVRSTAVFGGPNLVCTSRRFAGAWLTAVFGGITLDLRDALPRPEGASINATAAFGGIDILVPKGWRLSVRSTPIFGGLDDKTDHSAPPAADAPTLHIDALSMFGGVAIKNQK
jgi:predicted membrane protein